MRGNKQLAKELSRQGRIHNEAMVRLHKEAAAAIFSTRFGIASCSSSLNHCVLCRNTGKFENLIDLHGLHVDEAVTYLSQCDAIVSLNC